ncbi:hypothetical protein LCGC14_3066650 [marine sediment metagenome]|uniref:Uncharacterized protein n=1 Tax=marine sediment metagenome TaxID=412755 RepID=A0A0F8YQ12_9ZZZZ
MTEKDSIALFLAQLFTRPRCKPWDLVKGRRFRCCHALTTGEHGRGCMTGKTIHVPKFAEIEL